MSFSSSFHTPFLYITRSLTFTYYLVSSKLGLWSPKCSCFWEANVMSLSLFFLAGILSACFFFYPVISIDKSIIKVWNGRRRLRKVGAVDFQNATPFLACSRLMYVKRTTRIKLLWLRFCVKIEWRWVCKWRRNYVCVTLAGRGIWGMLEALPRSSQGILCLCYAFVYVGLFLIQAEGWEEKCGGRVCMTHAVTKACRGQGCKLHAHFIFRR